MYVLSTTFEPPTMKTCSVQSVAAMSRHFLKVAPELPSQLVSYTESLFIPTLVFSQNRPLISTEILVCNSENCSGISHTRRLLWTEVWFNHNLHRAQPRPQASEALVSTLLSGDLLMDCAQLFPTVLSLLLIHVKYPYDASELWLKISETEGFTNKSYFSLHTC